MTTEPVDTLDPSGMARWLRERAQANRDQPHERLPNGSYVLPAWRYNLMPHIAFRLDQAAQLIEQLDADAACEKAEKESLRDQVERQRAALLEIASYPPGTLRPLADEIAIHKLATEALGNASDVSPTQTEK